MKKLSVILALLLFAGPALAAVRIIVEPDGHVHKALQSLGV